MMRLANLLRPANTRILSARSGPPGWERPDPPPHEYNQLKGRILPIHIGFWWFDGSTPIYFLHNPEVYEGTLLEAFPKTSYLWVYCMLFCCVVGSFATVQNPKRKIKPIKNIPLMELRIKNARQIIDNKLRLKYMMTNPWKLNVWPEVYPHESFGVTFHLPMFETKDKIIPIFRKINNDALKYWNNLRQEAIAEGDHGHGASSGH